MRVLPSLQVGVEFNAVAEEVGPLVTWFLTTETEKRPAVFFGTSSDRIGSPAGEQAYYLTAAKHAPGWPISVYGSLNYSAPRTTVSLLWVWLERPGVSVSFGF